MYSTCLNAVTKCLYDKILSKYVVLVHSWQVMHNYVIPNRQTNTMKLLENTMLIMWRWIVYTLISIAVCWHKNLCIYQLCHCHCLHHLGQLVNLIKKLNKHNNNTQLNLAGAVTKMICTIMYTMLILWSHSIPLSTLLILVVKGGGTGANLSLHWARGGGQ